MLPPRKRSYTSDLREKNAEETKMRIRDAAKQLFMQKGIDKVTIAAIAERAGVAAPTVYALFKSKEGLLRALMRAALFGSGFETARRILEGETDPVRLVALTAHVARAIYDGESMEFGLIRGASAFSPALRKMEREFEQLRYDMLEERVRLLFEKGKQKAGLELDEARRILWMYTSRDIYRMLVEEGRWTADRYQSWLSETLVSALTSEPAETSPPSGTNT